MEHTTPLIWNPILRQYLVNAPRRMSRREGTSVCPFCADITDWSMWTNDSFPAQKAQELREAVAQKGI